MRVGFMMASKVSMTTNVLYHRKHDTLYDKPYDTTYGKSTRMRDHLGDFEVGSSAKENKLTSSVHTSDGKQVSTIFRHVEAFMKSLQPSCGTDYR